MYKDYQEVTLNGKWVNLIQKGLVQLNKEYLISLGLTEEQANQVLAQHQTEVDGLQPSADVTAQVTDLQNQLQTKDTELQTKDTEIANLQKENGELQIKVDNQKLENALSLHLVNVKAKNPSQLRKLISLEGVSVGEDGKLVGVDEQIETLKTESPYLFEDEKDKKETKPKITTGNHSKTDNEDPFVKGLLGN